MTMAGISGHWHQQIGGVMVGNRFTLITAQQI